MKLYATTYDVCKHEGWVQDMNTYLLNTEVDIYEQVVHFAKKDYSSLVVINMEKDGEWTEVTEYEFPEYACHCGE